MEAYYLPEGEDRFVSTPWTQGPWGEGLQHAGPVAALAGRAVERLPSEGPMRVARFTMEILRAVPIATLEVKAELVRPGKRVQMATVAVTSDGVEYCRASVWRMRVADAVAPEHTEGEPPPGPEGTEEMTMPDWFGVKHYLTSMEWRFGRGKFFEPGAAAGWARMRHALVAGEEVSPLSRVLALADSGNGISMVLPLGEYLFINTELSVHLVREPVDEWVCLDAVTRIDPSGIGLSESVLWDRRGRLGGGRQALYVDAR